ncbi:MAG: RNA polymerase sigma factor [Armatimonadetes bacterium]|nr:RNA polymerase sigma factor [Armatimonadota bacterium]
MDHVAERAARGDREALAKVVTEHYSGVFRFCSRLLDAQRAEDAAQETFLRAGKLIQSFRHESAIRTWLFGIALNVCRNERRKMKPTLPLQDWDHAPSTPDKSVIAAHLLREAMAQLDADHRDVVVLHEMEGLTYDECAQALGIPIGTVKSRLHYAFVRLRELLRDRGTAR